GAATAPAVRPAQETSQPPPTQAQPLQRAQPVRPAPAAPPLGSPSPSPSPSMEPELVPAGTSVGEAILRVQVEGPATYVVDGRTEHASSDGTLHLPPGHHRVTVSSPSLAFPRTLELDLRARESATGASARG